MKKGKEIPTTSYNYPKVMLHNTMQPQRRDETAFFCVTGCTCCESEMPLRA